MTQTLLQLDPPAATTGRTAVDLTGSSDVYVDVAGVNWGTSAIEPFLAAEQRWGSAVVSYRVPNREIAIPLHLTETGRSEIQAKAALFQREGGVLLRQKPEGDALYADIQYASLAIPDTHGETQGIEPNATLTLECLPDLYSDLVTLDPISCDGSTAAVLTLDGDPVMIAGDHPGRATIGLLDTSGVAQQNVVWAFRSRFYDPDAPLLYPAATALTPASGASVVGATIAGTATATWADLATLTGSHQGAYAVWATVTGATAAFRFASGLGDQRFAPTSRVTPPDGSPCLANLGTIQLDRMRGTQLWGGAVQILGTGTASVTDLYLQPLDDCAGAVHASPAILADGQLDIAWAGVERSVAGGASFMPLVPSGSLPRIPPSGLEARPVEVSVRCDGAATITVSYASCWVMRPA